MGCAWLSLVTCMKESCHMYNGAKSLVWISHVSRINESYHTSEWVVSQVAQCEASEQENRALRRKLMASQRLAQELHVQVCCSVGQCVAACRSVLQLHVQVLRVTRINESCHVHERIMSRSRISHVTRKVTSLIYNTLQRTATQCNAQEHTATHCNNLQQSAIHYHTLHHTITHYNTLQHAASHCNTLQHTATRSNTLQHTATHCNNLQHTAIHCNTL